MASRARMAPPAMAPRATLLRSRPPPPPEEAAGAALAGVASGSACSAAVVGVQWTAGARVRESPQGWRRAPGGRRGRGRGLAGRKLVVGAEGILELAEGPAVDHLDGMVEAVAGLDGGEEAGEVLLTAGLDEEIDHRVGLPVEEADLAGVVVPGGHGREGDEAVGDGGKLEGSLEPIAGFCLGVDGGALVEPGGNLAETSLAGCFDEDVGELVAEGVAAVAGTAAAVDDEDDVDRDLGTTDEGGGVVGLAAIGVGLLKVGLGGEEDSVDGDDLQLDLQQPAHAHVSAFGGVEEAAGGVLLVAVEVHAHEVVVDASPHLAGGQVDVAVLLALHGRAVGEHELPVVDELAADGDESEDAGGDTNLDPHIGGGLELVGGGAGKGTGTDDAVAENDLRHLAGSGGGEAEAEELGEFVVDRGDEAGGLGGRARGQAYGEAGQQARRGRRRTRLTRPLPPGREGRLPSDRPGLHQAQRWCCSSRSRFGGPSPSYRGAGRSFVSGFPNPYPHVYL